MKKLLMIICITAVTFVQAQSDPKLSLIGSVGVGFKIGGELYTSTTYNNSITPTSEEDKYFNYGGGLKLDLGAQYRLMEKLGARAVFAMSFGIPAFEVTNKRIVGNTTSSSTTEYKRNMYGVKLTLVPQFEFLDLLTMYTGAGLGFYWNSLHYKSDSDKGKIKSYPALGFNGMIGADYPLSDKFGLFAEIGFDLVSFKWKKMVSDDNGTTFYEKDDINNEAPKKVPGSNWNIRVGAKFDIL